MTVGDKLAVEVPYSTIIGVASTFGTQMQDGTRSLKVSPRRGKFYLAGIHTSMEDHDADLRMTIRHPRSQKPMLVNGRLELLNVPAVQFDASACTRSVEFFQDMFVPIWGTRHEDGDLEPTYCSEDLPLIIEVEGAADLYLSILGGDHYTVTRWPSPSTCPSFALPLPLGWFRGPYGDGVGAGVDRNLGPT